MVPLPGHGSAAQPSFYQTLLLPQLQPLPVTTIHVAGQQRSQKAPGTPHSLCPRHPASSKQQRQQKKFIHVACCGPWDVECHTHRKPKLSLLKKSKSSLEKT